MKGSDALRVGKIARVQLIINNWFILLFVIFSLAGMMGKVIAVFSAVLWHEAAHCLCAVLLGYRVREIELLPFGGVARIEGLSEAAINKEILMSVAGPAASLVLAAIVFCVMIYTLKFRDLLFFYFKVNILLGAFNLIPALPLDGGRILRALLSKIFTYEKATASLVKLSKIIGLVFLAWSVKEFWQYRTINFTWIIAGIFIYVGAHQEIQAASFRTMRILMQKKAQLSAQGIMPAAHFTVLKSLSAREVIRVLGPDSYNIILVIDEKFHLQGSITETELWEAIPYKGLYVRIGDLL